MFIGILSTITAYILVNLIALITNLIFFQRWDTHLPSLAHHHDLGLWVMLVPAVGGLIIGLMARYGSDKIRGHGIPEALAAIFGLRDTSRKWPSLNPCPPLFPLAPAAPTARKAPLS